MNTSKKFKLANIGLLVLTVLFLLVCVLCGVFSIKEKRDADVSYDENTTITYLINGEYTQDDAISFASGEINTIVVTMEYYNNDEDNRGTLDAHITRYVKTKDFSDQTVYGVFDDVDYIVKDLEVVEDKTIVTFTINYQTEQSEARNYISTNHLDDTSTAGKLDLTLVATGKDETSKEALVSISLLEDVVNISINKTITNNDTMLNSNYKLLLVAALGCFCLSLCFGVCLFISYKLSKMDDYQRRLFIIFKLNKGILVESNLENVENGFVVNSFKELLKVQNSVSLPILYSKNNENVKFVIKAGSSVYSYTITK